MRVADPRWLALATAFLLAGCSDDTVGLFPPTDKESHGTPVPEAPGVTLVVHVTGGGDRLRIRMEASNGGSETYLVPNSCVGEPGADPKPAAPFSIAARRTTSSTGDFPIYPAKGCDEVTTTTFPPRQTMEFETEWDGTFWSAASERQTVVLPGPHVIEVALELYVGPDAEPAPMVAMVPIEVLDV